MKANYTDKIKKIAGEITTVHVQTLTLDEPFIDFAGRFAHMPGTVALVSGGDLDCARYHILAAKPWLTFSGRNQDMIISAQGQTIHLKANPFCTLRQIVNSFTMDRIDLPTPIATGLFGYLSYDLKDSLEVVPKTSIDDLSLPQICFFAPTILVVHDKIMDSTQLYISLHSDSKTETLDNILDEFQKIASVSPPKNKAFGGDKELFRSNFTRIDYMDAIKRIKKYIVSGHVYQVNMSQRFEMGFAGDPFRLFKRLYKSNPAPFFAYINAGDHQVLSTSPERFIFQQGRRVETRPIKGTRPRGKTLAEDSALRFELEQSKKDDAELSMIVDLLRNDMGKVCKPGSVRVVEHKRTEAYQNVYHLVSVVEGILNCKHDAVDLIMATFPGGSITGCPKIRAMEIIDELEPKRRHIYTGAIGYVSFHDTMDLSIAIRTATIYKGKVFFSVGGGIVLDSDPADEYDETLHKGQTLMQTFTGNSARAKSRSFVWLNGVVRPASKATISVGDQGFLFGYGFFETIRADKANLRFLEDHIARLNRSWNHFFSDEPPDLTWNDVITQVLIQNGLANQIAAVKIIATMGENYNPPFQHTLLVTARPYTHRLAETKEPGLKLLTYPYPRESPLADYKTLNYLFYLLAGKWAKTYGGDEALISNPDKSVSETNTANILLIKGKVLIRPVSSHVLPGIMQNAVCKLLSSWMYRIEDKRVSPEELFSADEVLITNSLMGAVPATSLDGKQLGKPSDLWQKINRRVL